VIIMGILLGLAAALLYGSSDFGGGLLARRFGSVRVTVVGSAAAAVLAWAALILSGGPGPSVRAVAWGLAYFYATQFSMLAIAAVLVSLYPGVTVLLARTVLHERFSLAQRAGLGLCAVAVAAIALN
jgi:drug/metabolite transporter (DMT)-like permease